MKKTSCFLTLACLFFILAASTASGIEVVVDVSGPQDLTALKEGIGRTVTARCLAKGVDASSAERLSISILQLGETLSFDAVLETKPPKAFHRDLKGAGELSSAIDGMIGELFGPARPVATLEKPAVPLAPKTARAEIRLNFVATSITSAEGMVYVSGKDALYRIENGAIKPYWNPPRHSAIYRLYPYQDSLLAVTGRGNDLRTYLVREGRTVKKWDRCVVPFKGGLMSARITSNPDLPDGINRWTDHEAVDGSPGELPTGTDILSAMVSDVSPLDAGDETIAFDKFNCLTISNGRKNVWTSDTKVGTLPLYVESGVSADKADPPLRYYLKPRILLSEGALITIANNEGVTRWLTNVKMYESTHILAMYRDDPVFVERDLAELKNCYCADITLDKGDILALIVKSSTSFIQRIDL